MEPVRVKLVTRTGASPLGSWTYHEYRPTQLAGIVELAWYFDGPTVHRRKRVLPNGRVELLVNLGEPYRLITGAGRERLDAAWVGGMLSRPQVFAQPPHQRVLGVRLHPVGAYALLARPMRELSEQSVDLHDLVGRAAAELAGRCHEATTVEARFRLVTAWVSERIARGRGADESIVWVASRIDRSAGAASIAALRAETGLSRTRLVGAFREQLGVAPKLYARLVRFRRVLAMLQDGATPLADVALAAGYYDQPHMNAEFRALSGITPREFLAARHPVGDGSTTGEPRGDGRLRAARTQ